MFVVGSPERASRLAAIGRTTPTRAGLVGKAWALVVAETCDRKGLPRRSSPVNPGVGRTTVARPPRGSGVPALSDPVGSEAWLRLLGTGGIEDDAEALR